MSYRNVMSLMKATGCPEPRYLDVAVSFGKGEEHNWTNHKHKKEGEGEAAATAHVIASHASEIKKFGQVLKKFSRWQFIYIFVSIERALKMHGFSTSFAERIVYPLVALFFGTGNVTKTVPAAIFARVFTDPKLRLYDYCPQRFLSETPKMFAFPLFATLYEKFARAIVDAGGKVATGVTVTAVERHKHHVVVVGRRKGGVEEEVAFRETFDQVSKKNIGTTIYIYICIYMCVCVCVCIRHP